MLTDNNSPKLARTDINDMFADLGYGASGNVSPTTTTGEANKLVRINSSGVLSTLNSIIGSGASFISGYFLNLFGGVASSKLKFTNTTTGQTATDGFDVGIDANGNAEIRQRENLPLNIYTNNALALGLSATGEATGTAVSTTGEANKLFKFSAIANTMLHFLRIRKSSTSALNVQDDSSVDVFNVDTTNKIATSYSQKISSLAGTGHRMVMADSTGNLSASSIMMRGYENIISGGTITVSLPQTIPSIMYTVILTPNRSDFNGTYSCSIRDKLENEFKIHYWSSDGIACTMEWLLVY